MQQMTDEELAAAEAARQNLVTLTLHVTSSTVPIPTQEELNGVRQGTMTPDDIVDPGNPEMPHTHEQEQYIRDAIDNAGTAPQPIKPVMPKGSAPRSAPPVAPRPAPQRPPEPPKAA
jgi:hypothetical protein